MNEEQPTTAPVIEIMLGGKALKLCYTFWAFHEMNLNPMKPTEVAEYFGELSPKRAAEWVAAGARGYIRLMVQLARQNGYPPPEESVDDWTTENVLDVLDMASFGNIITAIKDAVGEPEKPVEAAADPNPQ